MRRYAAIWMVLMLVGLLPMAAAAASVGTVTRITGTADVTGADQAVRPLRLGDAVAQGDIVRTKRRAKVEITFEDGSLLRLAPATRVEISEFVTSQQETRGFMSLLRGKIQSIIKKRGLFGLGKRNRYEVQTPTAVCGVRGTNFWVSYQGGVSNMIFKEGAGYTYSKNKPGEVQNVEAGQSATVVSADQAPVVMPATDEEIRQHENDTDPSFDDTAGGGGDGEEPTTTFGEGEDPLDGVAGEGEGDVFDTMLTAPEPASVEDVYVPPTTEVFTEPTAGTIYAGGAGLTVFTSRVDLGDGLSATVSGQLNDAAGIGGTSLFGDAFTGPAPFGGTMDDGSLFEGTLGGQIGSWEGLLAAIWQNAAEGGYFFASLSDPDFAGEGSIDASGPVRRETKAGTFSTAAALSDAMFPVTFLAVPGFTAAPVIPSIMNGVGVTVATPAGQRLLSVWQHSETGTGSFAAGSGSLVSGAVGLDADGLAASYLLGTVNYSDDGAGHVAEGGIAGTAADPTGFDLDRFFYMDEELMGEIGRMYRAAYDPATGAYEAFGVGTATVDVLAASGGWGGVDNIYIPGSYTVGSDGRVAIDRLGDMGGLIGGIYAPWDGTADFTGIGTYEETIPGQVGLGLWDAPLSADGTEAATATSYPGTYRGHAAGYWTEAALASGTLSGIGAVVYLDDGRTSGGISLAPEILGYYYEGVGGVGDGMFKVDGTWTPDSAYSATGLNPATTSLVHEPFGGQIVGPYLAADTATSIMSGDIHFIRDTSAAAPVPWGVYGGSLEMLYDATSLPVGTSWQATIGGAGVLGDGQKGYYWGDVSWTWNADTTISGSIASGELITDKAVGTFSGPVWGLWEDGVTGQGGAVGQSIGTYDSQPLAFGASLTGAPLYLAGSTGSAVLGGMAEGLLGSSLAPWDGAADFTAMGTYGLSPVSDRYTWFDDLLSLYGVDSIGYLAGRWSGGGIEAAATGLYRLADGRTGVLLAGSTLGSGAVTGSYLPFGTDTSSGLDLGLWRAGGTLSGLDRTATVAGDVTLTSLDMSGVALAGAFNTSGAPEGDIYGRPLTAETRFYASSSNPAVYEQWGVFGILLGDGNSYDRRGSTAANWHGQIGGTLAVGSGTGSNGYFLMDVTNGAWSSDGVIGAGLSGTFLTPHHIGTMSGQLFGQNLVAAGSTDPWVGAAIGYYDGQPTAVSGEVDGSFYKTSETGLSLSGSVSPSALLGSAADPWTASGSEVLILGGESYVSDYAPLLWNDASVDATGAWGFLGGSVNSDAIDARAAFLYANPAGGAGTWRGSLTGALVDLSDSVQVRDMIRAAGTLTPSQRSTGTFGYADIVTEAFTSARLAGDFGGSGFLEARLADSDAFDLGGWTRYFADQGWGVFDLVLDGSESFENPDSAATFSAAMGGRAAFGGPAAPFDFGYFIAEIAGTWSGTAVAGTLANGRFLTPNRYGVVAGDLAGYNDGYGQWAASTLGDFYTTVNMAHGGDLNWVYTGQGAYGFEYLVDSSGSRGVFGLTAAEDLYAMGEARRYGHTPVLSFVGEDTRGSDTFRKVLIDFYPQGGQSLQGRGVGLYAYYDTGAGNWYGGTIEPFAATGTAYAKIQSWELLGDGPSGTLGAASLLSYGTTNYNEVLNGTIVGGQFDGGSVAGNRYRFDGADWGAWRAVAGKYTSSNPFEGYWLAVGNGDYQFDGSANVYDGAGVAFGLDPTGGTTGLAYPAFSVTMGTDPALSYSWYVDGTPAGVDLLGWRMVGKISGAYESIDNYDAATADFVEQGSLLGALGVFSGETAGNLGYLAMGEWVQDRQDNSYGQYIFREPLGDPDNTATPPNFYPVGWIGGALRNGVVSGNATTLYAADASAYLLFGDLAGNVYNMDTDYYDDGMWVAHGGLAKVGPMPAVDAASVISDPLVLDDLTYSGGSLSVGNSGSGGIDGSSLAWDSLSTGRQWGVWSLKLGGDSTGGDADWTVELAGPAAQPELWLQLAGREWTDATTGDMAGEAAGAWVDINDALTGVLGGRLKGTFDPDNWQAVALGTFIDTTTFFEMLDTNVEALRALHIPTVEIGRADLSGNSGGTLNLQVNMNDVAFFARRSGEAPAIWASNDVTGRYDTAAAPGAGTSVVLSGSSATANLDASFTVNQWSRDGNWSAAVDGSGTVSSHSVTMTGAAAGHDNGDQTFNGTAAGVSK